MAERSSEQALRVQLTGPDNAWRDVGTLRFANEITWFEYVPEYWETPRRPVLGQVFEERGRNWRPSKRVAIPTWFSHLLPEGYLRQAVSEAVGVDRRREFLLLKGIGADDLPGAVRVIPWKDSEQRPPPQSDSVELVGDERSDPMLKFSLAGLQPKFSVLLTPGRGLTMPARGQAGDWIVKLPDRRPGFDAVPESEFGTLRLANASGISVPEIRLVRSDDLIGLPDWVSSLTSSAFAIKRFDRKPNGGRIHAEVLAQVLDVPTANDRYKYLRANFETIAAVVGALCGPESVGEVIDRIILNVLVGNGDAHLKNWAVIYPDSRNAELSPAYDMLPTVLYIPSDDLGLKLNGSRAFHDVIPSSFERLARRSGWEVAAARSRVLDAVERVVANWDLLSDHLSSESFRALTKRRDNLPLLH